MRLLSLLAIVAAMALGGCHYHRPPGHDPHGPGNSENAPGHNKKYDQGNSQGQDQGQKKKSKGNNGNGN